MSTKTKKPKKQGTEVDVFNEMSRQILMTFEKVLNNKKQEIKPHFSTFHVLATKKEATNKKHVLYISFPFEGTCPDASKHVLKDLSDILKTEKEFLPRYMSVLSSDKMDKEFKESAVFFDLKEKQIPIGHISNDVLISFSEIQTFNNKWKSQFFIIAKDEVSSWLVPLSKFEKKTGENVWNMNSKTPDYMDPTLIDVRRDFLIMNMIDQLGIT